MGFAIAVVVFLGVCILLLLFSLLCAHANDRETLSNDIQALEEKERTLEKQIRDAEAKNNENIRRIADEFEKCESKIKESARSYTASDWMQFIESVNNLNKKELTVQNCAIAEMAMQLILINPAENRTILKIKSSAIMGFSIALKRSNGHILLARALDYHIGFFDTLYRLIAAEKREDGIKKYVNEGLTRAEATNLYEQKLHNEKMEMLQRQGNNEQMKKLDELRRSIDDASMRSEAAIAGVESAQRQTATMVGLTALSIYNRR